VHQLLGWNINLLGWDIFCSFLRQFIFIGQFSRVTWEALWSTTTPSGRPGLRLESPHSCPQTTLAMLDIPLDLPKSPPTLDGSQPLSPRTFLDKALATASVFQIYGNLFEHNFAVDFEINIKLDI
jgi:hypothetical protein